jgi:hypothetical protein
LKFYITPLPQFQQWNWIWKQVETRNVMQIKATHRNSKTQNATQRKGRDTSKPEKWMRNKVSLALVLCSFLRQGSFFCNHQHILRTKHAPGFGCVGQDAEPCGNLCSQAFGSFLQVVVRGEEVSGLVRNDPSPPTVKPHAPAG